MNARRRRTGGGGFPIAVAVHVFRWNPPLAALLIAFDHLVLEAIIDCGGFAQAEILARLSRIAGRGMGGSAERQANREGGGGKSAGHVSGHPEVLP